jgi:hypothetical protein
MALFIERQEKKTATGYLFGSEVCREYGAALAIYRRGVIHATQEHMMKSKGAVRATAKDQTSDTVVINMESLEPPMLLDMPDLGPQEHVDPIAAATRILAAHQTANGNSSTAARLMGLTYQGLRRAIRRFECPRRCADGVMRRIEVEIDGRKMSLNEAVQSMHTAPNNDELAADVRVRLGEAVAAHIRLVDLARSANVDPTRLTKFRKQTCNLAEHELTALLSAVDQLRDKPIQPRSGRRAAA